MPYRGLSAYALMAPSFPVEQFLRLVEQSPFPATAVLYGTYGEAGEHVGAYCNHFRDRPHFLEGIPTNEVGRRNNRLGEGELFIGLPAKDYNHVLEHIHLPANAGYKHDLTVRIQQTVALLQVSANSNTYGAISTGLEDNYTDAAYRNVLSLVRANWSGAIIRNAVGNNKSRDRYGALFSESHNNATNKSSDAIVNEDGVNHTVGQTQAWMKSNHLAFARLIWRATHQGYTEPFTMPRKRHFTIPEKDVRELGLLLR